MRGFLINANGRISGSAVNIFLWDDVVLAEVAAEHYGPKDDGVQ
jgi:hypothetical protein